MDLTPFIACEVEKPLDRLLPDGGFCAIFRTIGCIGDSLSSGEFESQDEAGTRKYNDIYTHSWGQYLGRMTGAKVYNFSRGGMMAKTFMEGFGQSAGCFDSDKLCDAYILALGVNDILGKHIELGTTADIDPENPERNAKTFAGYYAQIIQRLKQLQPRARFFLMTMPHDAGGAERDALICAHAGLIHEIAALFDRTYVLDFEKYAPVYDRDFHIRFYLGGHMNPMGYLLTAKMTASYIDYIIRQNPRAFAQVGFIGTDLYNVTCEYL